MNKKTKGTVAELAVAARLMEDGWHVSMPIGEDHRYDLIGERKSKFIRVQVKYVTPKNGVLDVNCRSSNNWSVLPYTADEIDVIAAYDGKSRQIYFIPVSKINSNILKLRLQNPKNNQKLKINFARDFIEYKF